MSNNQDRAPLLSLTPSAVFHIKDMMQKKGAWCLRIALKKGGCAGVNYNMTYEEKPLFEGEILEDGGARVFVAREAILFLLGSTIDYKESLLSSALVVHNPNQVDCCGCGLSVTLKSADMPPAFAERHEGHG